MREIARELDTTPTTVSLWRGRFARQGLDGLEDLSRCGTPPIYGAGTDKSYSLGARPTTSPWLCASDDLFFSREARLSAPTDAEAQKYRNLAVPTLLVRSSRLAFHATMYRAEGDLEACWNRMLTIFEPHTFSRSEGQKDCDVVVRF